MKKKETSTRVANQKQESPYAERHVRWCERRENESRKKTTSFSSYYLIFFCIFTPLL